METDKAAVFNVIFDRIITDKPGIGRALRAIENV
ncbi:hypothetical protein CCP2SC5_920020 [Azospirillaceae bacterium]